MLCFCLLLNTRSWIRVSLWNLQKELKREGDFPKRNSILLRYYTLLSIFYWKALKLVLLLIFLARRYINFQSKFEPVDEESKYCCEKGMWFYLFVSFIVAQKMLIFEFFIWIQCVTKMGLDVIKWSSKRPYFIQQCVSRINIFCSLLIIWFTKHRYFASI